ncbi:GNAT family protein [Caulobacter sp. 73W]|uniref:GNAT family protein n=1 Tax=Caulobacter sp. 73W TaxID=3161137 RepID=A0AB39KPL0_9CAUL
MGMLDWLSPRNEIVLQGESVTLRSPRMADHAEWAKVREASRAFLQPWEPTWPQDDLTRAAFSRRIEAYDRELTEGLGVALAIRETRENRLVGLIRMHNIRRGVAETASLGYWIGEPFARRGYGLAAVNAVSAFAFGPFRLSRLEAQCLPDNEPSRRLLLKAGFSEEGYARAYLKINGEWRDHRLFGLVSRVRALESPDSAGA